MMKSNKFEPAIVAGGKKLMKTLVFRGYSDDTFGEYGVTGDDVDTCASYKPVQCRIDSLSGSMLVVGQYSVTHPPDEVKARYGACGECVTERDFVHPEIETATRMRVLRGDTYI